MFYNAAMALDRDLGVAVLAAQARRRGRPLRGWEMLSATGVRGLRVLNESPALAELWLTEANPEAFRVLEENAGRFADRGARVREWDAVRPVPEPPFDYVDLDPFGSPLPFLPAAFAALAPEGLLAVTATDMPVLAGVQAAACERRYGARPVRGRLGPEGGLRILMRYLAQVARDGGRGFDPLVAYVLDHHIRVYALISSRPRELPVDVMGGAGYLGPPLAGDGPFGPMWVGPLFDRSFLRDLRAPPSASRPKELGTLLERFLEESEVDAPFYFEPNLVARDAGVSRPPSIRLFLEALRKEGYRAGRTHVRASAFRTDAPRAAVLEVARRLSDLA